MFELAERLGGRTVHELESVISQAEFIEWQAYKNIKAEQYEKIDYYFAQMALCAMLPHIKTGRNLSINDFLIKFGKPKKKKISPREFRNAVCAAFGIDAEKVKRNG